MNQKFTVKLHDGALLDVEVTGSGPWVLLPVNPVPMEGAKADLMRQYGTDPALGRHLIDGLADAFTVAAFDYEGHVQAHPKPDTLTPDNVARDFLAVANAVGATRFAYYGYSWLALAGLQLANRTDRLSALVMGGYPPIEGPQKEMLAVTRAGNRMAEGPDTGAEWSAASLSKAQTKQFVTLYEALEGFDDAAAAAHIACAKMCFAGSKDQIAYPPEWGGVTVDMAAPLIRRGDALVRAGWEVHILDGLDHTTAMQSGAVLPVVKPWLERVLPR